MPSPKIVLYFTPDVKEIGRIPIDSIKFEPSAYPQKGRYQISLKHSCFISGNCSSSKFAVKSTASLTFQDKSFGEKTKYIFKKNDYFEIWDEADIVRPWCFFRGVVTQRSKSDSGEEKRLTLTLENAGGWLLGDNSVYYLGSLIVARGQTANPYFKPIKEKYGWLSDSDHLMSDDEAGYDLY